MDDLTLTSFGNGSIRFVGKVDEVPPSTTVDGNVTINNSGTPGVPAHFETTTMIQAQIKVSDVTAFSTFHLNDVVLSENADVPYREIEYKAARRLAPMLRAIADQIDQEMARFDEREKERKAGL